jgi:hypothetical protein
MWILDLNEPAKVMSKSFGSRVSAQAHEFDFDTHPSELALHAQQGERVGYLGRGDHVMHERCDMGRARPKNNSCPRG